MEKHPRGGTLSEELIVLDYINSVGKEKNKMLGENIFSSSFHRKFGNLSDFPKINFETAMGNLCGK